jgi:hypothetical protein
MALLLVGEFVEVVAVDVFFYQVLEGDFNIHIILPIVLGVLPEPTGGLAFGGGAGGTAGSGVRWWYCGDGDAIAGEPGGFVFKHPDVPMLAASDVAANGASVGFQFA